MTRPFLKWVGGKQRSVAPILAALPHGIDTYYEPFLGGGAVFFALAEAGRFRRAVLSDLQPDLVATWEALQRVPREVVGELERLTKHPIDLQRYREIRDSSPRSIARRAARFIVINKLGYNGLWRVNAAGRCNVPFGRYKNPRVFNARHLLQVGEALRGVTIRCEHWAIVLARVTPSDAVYFDPPYLQRPTLGGFVSYTSQGFSWLDHVSLADACRSLTQRGIAWAASNSDTPRSLSLYEHRSHQSRRIEVGRQISSKVSTRKPTGELLFWHRPEQAAQAAEREQ